MQVTGKSPRPSLVTGQYSTNQVGRLVHWIGRGDEASFDLFFESTMGLLSGLLLRILGHTQTADEVLTEVYEEVRRRAAQFGRQNERPLTWLILIAHRRAIERLCSKLETNSKRLQRLGNTPTLTSINITEQRRLLREALNELPSLQHRMIELAFFSGMTSTEISQEVGESPEEVEREIRLATLQLFRLFKSMGFSVESRHKFEES